MQEHRVALRVRVAATSLLRPKRAAATSALPDTTAPAALRPTHPALLGATALREAVLALHALQRYFTPTHDAPDSCWVFADSGR